MRAAGPAAALVLALIVGWFETASAEGFNPTAMVYIDVARHLARGEGVSSSILFTTSVPRVPAPMSVWPPVYPVTITLLAALGLDVAAAARIIALAAFGLSALLVWWLANALYGARAAMVSATLLAVWPAMTRVATNAWSESLFVLCLLASVALTFQAIRPRRLSGGLAAALGGLVMGTAALTRYAALPLIPWGAVLVLVLVQDTRWRARVVRAAVWGIMAGLPVAAWLARNVAVTGGLIGAGRQRDDLGPLYHIVFASRTVVSDLLGLVARVLVVPEWVGLEAERMMALVLLVVAGGIVVLVRRRELRGRVVTGITAAVAPPEARFTLLMALGYWGAMIVARSTIGFYPLDSRLMMPVYPLALLLLVAAGLAVFDAASRTRASRIGGAVVLAALLAVLVLVVPRSLAAGGPRLRPDPAPAWVQWAATQTTPDTLIVGNLSFDYNFYLERPVIEFSSNRFGISRFDCQGVSTLLGRLNMGRAYFILRADRGRFDPESMGELYDPLLERVLKGEAVLPLRLVARAPEFAAYEVLSGQWPCP
jgi:4-amino-4-deoxy-L-arabinose transferase-like glycosyltransferase